MYPYLSYKSHNLSNEDLEISIQWFETFFVFGEIIMNKNIQVSYNKYLSASKLIKNLTLAHK